MLQFIPTIDKPMSMHEINSALVLENWPKILFGGLKQMYSKM